MDYIQDEAISASVSEFSWDLKYAGAQILLSGVILISFSQHLHYTYITFSSLIIIILLKHVVLPGGPKGFADFQTTG